ncbi:hypothetical protein GCM10010313_74190 [Streptomyces violarus]|uniref:hypothetical protein n=1 Tax=Streptomyces TaxID=1883 RepID=UPI001615D48E|nr:MULTISPECIES: hypothetical protein [Streptomyces]WRT99202.1 hypothetical protein VJ737_16545 [Streptomyces sp. CGMCC 4.1772]GHD31123.1 hypothetical protein GCM10010313_74190 [Streptomyces violarus]
MRRMEPGWSSDEFYPISAYDNDLDSRDALDEVMRTLPAEGRREGALGRLLAWLDARFHAVTLPDPERSLRPRARPTNGRPEEELGVWWKRKPVRVPWAE